MAILKKKEKKKRFTENGSSCKLISNIWIYLYSDNGIIAPERKGKYLQMNFNHLCPMVIIQLWQEKTTLAKGFKIPIMMKGNRVNMTRTQSRSRTRQCQNKVKLKKSAAEFNWPSKLSGALNVINSLVLHIKLGIWGSVHDCHASLMRFHFVVSMA